MIKMILKIGGLCGALIILIQIVTTAHMGQEVQHKPIPSDTNIESSVISYEAGFIQVKQGKAFYYDTKEADEKLLTITDIPLSKAIDCKAMPVIAGANGQFFYWTEGKWHQSAIEQVQQLEYMQEFKDTYIAADATYVIPSSNLLEWEQPVLSVEGNIVGLQTNDRACIALTDTGEIWYSQDTAAWKCTDYNELYGTHIKFEGVRQYENIFYAFGSDLNTHQPILMSSLEGEMWYERKIDIYENDKLVDLTNMPINDILWDGSQALLLSQKGWIWALPECVNCNKRSQKGTVDWKQGVCAGGIMALTDADGNVSLVETESVRQTAISSETALAKLNQGCPIIDVRSASDYKNKHIKGSINIPLDYISEQLPQRYPDYSQTIIFYCQTGKRSQSALEKAKELGYADVYNLGSIDNWNYETQQGN